MKILLFEKEGRKKKMLIYACVYIYICMYIAKNEECDSLYLSITRKQKLKQKQKRTKKIKKQTNKQSSKKLKKNKEINKK